MRNTKFTVALNPQQVFGMWLKKFPLDADAYKMLLPPRLLSDSTATESTLLTRKATLGLF